MADTKKTYYEEMDRDSISESDVDIINKRYHESVLSVREVTHPTNYLETTIHVLKANIGAGCFAMGDCVKNSGLIIGPLGLLLVGIICTYTTRLLLVCARKCKLKWRLPVDPTFSEAIEFSFKLGPSGFKKTSVWAKGLVTISLLATQLGFCSVYFSALGKTTDLYLDLAGWDLDVRYTLLFILPVVLGLSLIRNLKYLAPLSLVANFFLVLSIGVVVGMIFWDLPNTKGDVLVAPYERWPLAIGTMIFTYEGINLVIPLRNEMRNPQQFVGVFGVLNVSMGIIMSIYIIFGVLSYWKFGDEVLGMVTYNLEKGHWSKIAASTFVGIALILSYPLQFYVALKLLLEIFAHKFERIVNTKKRLFILEICLRVVLVIFTCIAAICIPHLALLISIVGAMFGIWLAIIMPVLSHMALFSPWSKNHKTENLEQPSYKAKIWLGFWFHIFLLALGLFGFVTGSFVTIKELIITIKKDQEKTIK